MDEYKILSNEVRREILRLLGKPTSKTRLYRELRKIAFYTNVYKHLRILKEHGYVEEDDGTFRLTEEGKRLRAKVMAK